MTRKATHHQEEIQKKSSAEVDLPQEVPAEPLASDPVTGLEAELELQKQQVEKLREEVIRRAAEFENFRKQKEREASQAASRSLENTVRELLPLLDDLKRLMHHIPAEMQAMSEAKPFIEGVELIRKNFTSWLESKGVREIAAKGQMLDVNFHEAITQIDHPDAESDSIVEEYQTGYTLGERVIRHAKVIVAR
ncbi:MAG: nucleotide exchange factor GrpE [Chlorobiaceae bacterium]|nr:nucleotide exchange factor GrpE [Chlorobiaceae bacterium]NTW73948.1 nucleotide exchange factor GrpE [Chlorobiaceae bacterium]